MTTSKSALPYLLKYAGLTTSFVQPLQRELDFLAQTNAADCRNVSRASSVLLKSLPKLGPTIHRANYSLDAIGRAVEALRPYVKEAHPCKVPKLLQLVSLEFPAPVVAQPPLTVSDDVWSLWDMAKSLRTVETLKQHAAAKGLCLVETDSGQDKGYAVFDGTTLVAKNRVYRYAANFIENCRPAHHV